MPNSPATCSGGIFPWVTGYTDLDATLKATRNVRTPNLSNAAKGTTDVMTRKLIMPLAALLWLYAAWAAAEPLPKYRQVANALLDDINQATWVSQGGGNRVLYIFFDPNCPYCHRLYLALSPLVKSENLQLRWIPVGMLADASLSKAAAILQARDPLAAFKDNEGDFDMSDAGPGGYISPATHILDKTRLDLATNLGLLQAQNIAAVPVVVLRANDGDGLMFQGVPPDKILRRVLEAVRSQGSE